MLPSDEYVTGEQGKARYSYTPPRHWKAAVRPTHVGNGRQRLTMAGRKGRKRDARRVGPQDKQHDRDTLDISPHPLQKDPSLLHRVSPSLLRPSEVH